MSKYLLNESTIQDIADAIREMNGESTLYTPSELADAILEIPGGDYLKPLCFTSKQNGSTVYLKSVVALDIKLSISYDGITWTEWIKNSSGVFNTITLNNGDKVYIKGKNTRFSTNTTSSYCSTFYMTGKIYASGNIMSLLDPSGKLLTLNGRDTCFCSLFKGCTSLFSSPDLPAITLSYACYGSMFYGCTNLVKAPLLPAMVLARSCYSSMFNGCTSLIYGPAILPAITLFDGCYGSMFYNCSNLIYAPKLPATNVINYSYTSLFYGCSKLNSITVSATSWTNYCAVNWVKNVSATGTFIKPTNTSIPTGVNGIPSGWTVVNV